MRSGDCIRMTKQRQVILDVLERSREHPTADQIYELVRRRMPHISLGTVYRNLEMLSRCGKIRKLHLGGAQMRFDADTERHGHIRCLRCGLIVDLPGGGELPSCDIEMLDKTGFDIMERRVEFVGLCPACKKNEPEEGS